MESKIGLILSMILGFCVFEAYCNPVSESKTYPVESKDLYTPCLKELVEALNKNLTITFENVKVSIVDCPDLREAPFSLALQGLGGSPTLFEAGSELNLLPTPDKSKVYDFKDVSQETGVDPTCIIGAGGGPFLYLKTASEIIANLNITNSLVHSLTQIGTMKDGKLHTEVIPDYITHYGFMANLFICQGKPGKVIEVKVSKRIGDDNFPSAVRETVKQAFPGNIVGLGGAFLVQNSKINIHVQQQFSEVPLVNDTMRDEWLVFLNVSAPVVGLGTIITGDPGLQLRPYHFHCLSDHNVAGHFHHDLDSDNVEYTGYFNLAEKVVRMDKPQKKNSDVACLHLSMI